MSKVTFDISLSLDGFMAGPRDSVEQGLGEGGERLHEWLVDLESFHSRHGASGGEHSPDSDILDEAFRNMGAAVMGRRMFDLAEVAWGPNPPFHVPVFVLTHRPRPRLDKEGGTSFIFVTDGLASALAQARAAAGDRDISLSGGADSIQQALAAGLVDEFQLHLVPLLLGAGKQLFGPLPAPLTLETLRVIASPGVTHIKYRVVRDGLHPSAPLPGSA